MPTTQKEEQKGKQRNRQREGEPKREGLKSKGNLGLHFVLRKFKI